MKETPTMAKRMTFEEYQKEMPKPFPRVQKGGSPITPKMREEQYAAILVVGVRLLHDWFKTGNDDLRTDLTGYPKTKWRHDPQYQAFMKEFTPSKVGDQAAKTRLWDAVKLASQEAWLTEHELSRLSTIEKMKLITMPNDNDKISRCKELFSITEQDVKKKQRAVKQVVEGISVSDIIAALNSGDLGFFNSLATLEPVIRKAEGNEAKELLKAFNTRIKKIERNIIPLLRAMVSMVTVEDEE
jgi:hypothetical protein